jgi:membrane associated rhomboid family serine protease
VSRYAPADVRFSFGPGRITPAVRAIIIANVAVFLLEWVAARPLIDLFGLSPAGVLHGRVWQLATYLFLHSPSQLTHILFNMLAVWMFGVELEQRWGTRNFVRYYFLTGIGAGVSMILVALLPFAATRATFDAVTIGASGAVYGILMAWAILFPHRQILFMLIFPLPARVYVLIMGGIAFLSAVSATASPVANVAHLGGLVAGLLYLKGPRNLRVKSPGDLRLELRYRLTKWRMDRMRRKFNLHKGGRDDWDKWIH